MSGIKRIYINARFLTQPVTGVQRYAIELVKALDCLIEQGEIKKFKYRFELLAPRKGLLRDLHLKHITLRKVGVLTGHAWEQLELPMYSAGGLLFCPGNTAPALSLLAGRKTVVTVHSLSYLYIPEAYSAAFRTLYGTIMPLVLRKANKVITVSQSEKKLITGRYGDIKNIHVIQNGTGLKSFVDENEKLKVDKSDSAEPFLLFVGSISKGKNLQGVLEALSILNKSRDVNLVVVGAGGKTFKGAEACLPGNIINKVFFKGQIDEVRELIHLYKTAFCLVFPSFYESWGLPAVEAMTCGCPVIASNIPALAESCGDAALYCDPFDPADIAVKIQGLMDDEALRQSLIQKGLARAGRFTWDKCARETFAIIEEAL